MLRTTITLGAVLALSSLPGAAAAQLEQETATRSVDHRKLKVAREGKVKHELDSFKGRYRYQIDCHRRLLPLDKLIRRCIDSDRMVNGEFHTRLDFVITPDGKVTSFITRRDQLQACLLPKMLTRRFPAFASKKHKTYKLIVLVASPGCRLGRRVKAKPVAIYPVGTPEGLKTYKRAAGWVMSPWTRTIGTCVELIDRELGFGYRARFGTEIGPEGKPVRTGLVLKGKLAKAAADRLMTCVAPFLKKLRAPKHDGAKPVLFIHGSSSARWGMD
jgi:hypothetical protein